MVLYVSSTEQLVGVDREPITNIHKERHEKKSERFNDIRDDYRHLRVVHADAGRYSCSP